MNLMIRTAAAFALGSVLVFSGQVFAAPPIAPVPPTAPAAPIPPTSATRGLQPGSEMICRRQEDTGSRLGGRRMCHTRQEWEQISNEARNDIDRASQTVIIPH